MRQFGPDQRSGCLSEAGSDQEHFSQRCLWMGFFSRRSLWMGQHTAILPLLILLALCGSGQGLCSHSLHKIPFILWLSNVNLSFWFIFLLLPHSLPISAVSLSRCTEGQNGTEYSELKCWLLFFSVFLYPPTSLQASAPPISSCPFSHKDLEQRLCFNFSFLPQFPSLPFKSTLLWLQD